MILNKLLNGVRRWLGPIQTAAPVDANPPRPVALRQSAPPPPPPSPPPAMADSGKRGRPISHSLARTLEVLAANPEISPVDLASRLRVSPSYARTLLRRARSRTPEPVSTKPGRAAVANTTSIQPVEPVLREASTTDDPLLGLAERLHQAEVEIRQLRTARPATKVSWDVHRRAEVLRRSLAGESAQHIAADLRIPSGEVAFILKVHQILAAAN